MDRVKQCHYCNIDLVEDWNLFPVGQTKHRSRWLYDWEKVLCDECYDAHCTREGFGMLRIEE